MAGRNIHIEASSLSDGWAPDHFIKQTLEEASVFLLQKGVIVAGSEVELSVAVVDKNEMRGLNKKYRDKDEATDVLSFAYESSGKKTAGEIILCTEVIADNAKQDGIKPEEELAKNIVHGLLHIAGLEHGEKMFDLQNEFLKKLEK